MQLPNDQDSSGRTLGEEEILAVADAIRSGTLTSTKGTFVKQLESRFAQWLGVEQAWACASGTAAVHRHRLDHWNTEFFLDAPTINTNAALRGGVTHIKGKNHWQTKAPQFKNEPQMQSEVGCVGHADNGIRPLFAGKPTKTDISRNLFVRTGCCEAVGPRQVKHFHGSPGWRYQSAGLAFYCDARVVGNFLTTTRQQVEQRGFSTIGISDKSDT